MNFIQQNFNVHLLSSQDGNLKDIEDFEVLLSLPSTTSFFGRNPVQVLADPFLFVHQDILYCFYEEQVSVKKGLIKMICTHDLIHWSNPKTILKEDCHLSFPFVFRAGNDNFMIPETHQKKEVRLYLFNEEMSGLSLSKTLLSGKAFVDSFVFLHEQTYYLFTTTRELGKNHLHLYYADSLSDDFIQHPKSPIFVGDGGGQSAGAVFCEQGQLFRPAQISQNYYGENVCLFRINHLSKTDYQEEKIQDKLHAKKDKSSLFYKGGHHICGVKYKGQNVFATDSVVFTFNLFAFFDRVKKILSKSKL